LPSYGHLSTDGNAADHFVKYFLTLFSYPFEIAVII
jgi:hypothetical protein